MSTIIIKVVDGKLVPLDEYTGRIVNIPPEEIHFLFAFAKGKDEEMRRERESNGEKQERKQIFSAD